MISIAIAARFSECNIESIDTKLHTYAHSGDVKGLREVLLSTSSAKSGSNGNLINKRNHLGCTALRLAATCGHADCVDILLSHGAKTDIADIKGQTPLFVSVKNGHIKCVETLLRHGANPEGDDDVVYSPLYIAAMNGYNEILQLLIKYGADLSQRRIRVDRSFRNDPLQIAIAYHHYNCCKTLLCAGYDANAVVSMYTMYHVADKHKCDVKFLKLLYEFGVHFFTRDQKGKYPWELEPFETKDSAICSKYLISIKENSRSLLSACRLTIRKSMRDIKRMNQLCLPVYLLDYLNYKHL
ncbi:hypothetical protein SNE40_009194 [Patella caerulea]|uniref:SOCS box domain-containing protein n=1 Tax=Patella caerulea TaxID=87958 RepID=A0AAN8JXZ7_PATCE